MLNRITAAIGGFFNSTTNTMIFAAIISTCFVFGIISAGNSIADRIMLPTPAEQANTVLSLICEQCMPDSVDACKKEMPDLEGKISAVDKNNYNLCISDLKINKCEEGIPTACYIAFIE